MRIIFMPVLSKNRLLPFVDWSDANRRVDAVFSHTRRCCSRRLLLDIRDTKWYFASNGHQSGARIVRVSNGAVDD